MPRSGNRVRGREGPGRLGLVPARVMFVQLKTGHDIDKGPAWISVVRFNRTWKTAMWHGKALRRWPGCRRKLL